MEEFNKVSPLLDNWTIGEKIENDGSADVYLVSSDGSGMGSLAILKHYSYPKSKAQLDALYYAGTVSSEKEAKEYIAKVVKEQAYELSYLKRLKDSQYIFTALDYQILEKSEYPGFDIYVLMDYTETLSKYLKYNAMTHLRAINLGIDICSALEDLRANGLIHQNLKPSNIFISNYGQYMLGDFGYAEISRLNGSYVPENYINDYSAPEITGLMGQPNTTMDIYSLGLVLYRIMNANHAPFEDEKTSASAAKQLRESGEELPVPMYADYELSEIILKACAFKPEDRYQTPTEFKNALKDYYLRNTVPDELIVPPINNFEEDDDWEPDFEEELEPVKNVSVEELDEDFKQNFTPSNDVSVISNTSAEVPKKSNRSFWIGMLIVCLVICVAGFFAFKYWPTVEVYSIDAEVTGSDVIIVSWESGGYNNQSWNLTCADAYGNKSEHTVNGSSYVLSELAAGTQYEITIEPSQGYVRMNGVSKTTVSTISHTTVADFRAEVLSSTSVRLDWTVNGTAPESWNITYTVDGSEVVKNVTGNSIEIDGLISGDYYTFNLSTDFETLVSGSTVVSCQTPWHTEMSSLEAVSNMPTTIDISWKSKGHTPEVWELTCTASDGSFIKMNVVGNSWTVENLLPDTEYTFDVVPSGNYETSGQTSVSCKTGKCEILSIDYSSNSPFSGTISWTVDGIIPEEWSIEYGVVGDEVLSELVTSSSIAMSALYPASTYTFKLSAPSQYSLSGVTETTFTTANAEQFTDYGCKNVSIYMYLSTDTEYETPMDTFTSNQSVNLVISAEYDETSEDKSVSTAYFIRNNGGKIVSYTQGQRTWSGEWTELDHTDALTTLPEEPGIYTLEIYFNGKILATKEFYME